MISVISKYFVFDAIEIKSENIVAISNILNEAGITFSISSGSNLLVYLDDGSVPLLFEGDWIMKDHLGKIIFETALAFESKYEIFTKSGDCCERCGHLNG